MQTVMCMCFEHMCEGLRRNRAQLAERCAGGAKKLVALGVTDQFFPAHAGSAPSRTLNTVDAHMPYKSPSWSIVHTLPVSGFISDCIRTSCRHWVVVGVADLRPFTPFLAALQSFQFSFSQKLDGIPFLPRK